MVRCLRPITIRGREFTRSLSRAFKAEKIRTNKPSYQLPYCANNDRRTYVFWLASSGNHSRCRSKLATELGRCISQVENGWLWISVGNFDEPVDPAANGASPDERVSSIQYPPDFTPKHPLVIVRAHSRGPLLAQRACMAARRPETERRQRQDLWLNADNLRAYYTARAVREPTAPPPQQLIQDNPPTVLSRRQGRLSIRRSKA